MKFLLFIRIRALRSFHISFLPEMNAAGQSGPCPKKARTENIDGLQEAVSSQRKEVGSIIDFGDFKKKRVRVLSNATEVKQESDGIVYWMSRDCRVQDNWALLYAQKLALKNRVPFHVCFSLVPKFLDDTLRHYKFLLTGLREVAEELHQLNIPFHMLLGAGGKEIPKFVKAHNIGGVVCDFNPLREPLAWMEDCKANLPEDVPFCQVDAHNIVPVWEASDKQEYAARTIRPKINKKLEEYLQTFPMVQKHPHRPPKKGKEEPIDWDEVYAFIRVDKSVDEVKELRPGYKGGMETLNRFIASRLKLFNTKRNDPNIDALSNLSPWFHFGQISVQRAVLEVRRKRSQYPESVAAFCEEAIVRRELSDNFCFYNKDYDNFKGLTTWAQKTLNDHRKDKREYLYTKKEFEEARTHDDLWNAAQIQMVRQGKMHGFLRMYWAKKILEWTHSPEEALDVAIYLNDRYNLDGGDSNGFVGVMVRN